MKTSYSTTRNKKTPTASSSSSSSSHTGPRGGAAGDDEDEADEMIAAINKLLTQPINAEERQFSRTLEAYIADHGGPRAILQRCSEGGDNSNRNTNTNSSKNNNNNNNNNNKEKRKKKKKHTNNNNTISVAATKDEANNTTARAILQRSGEGEEGPYHSSNGGRNTGSAREDVIPSATASSASAACTDVDLPIPRPPMMRTVIARALLTEKGFDPDDLNKRNKWGWIPICYYINKGNVTMIRYLILRDVDCRKDRYGWFPMFWAAYKGHVEIITLLFYHGGAHEDIRKVTSDDWSPLRVALHNGHFHVVYWLILIGALTPRNDVDVGGIYDATMRRDLRQEHDNDWDNDYRRTVLVWARGAVSVHDTFQNLIPTKKSPLPEDIWAKISDFVAGTQQQLRTLRQLIDHLSVFIDDVPFVEEDEDDDDDY